MSPQRELTSVFAVHQSAHQRQNERKKLLWLWFPFWNVLLCWMSACLWLIMLPFTRLSQCPIPTPRRASMEIRRARWSVTSRDCRCRFPSSSPNINTTLHCGVTKVCTNSFLSSPSRCPADKHVHPGPTCCDQTRRTFLRVTPSRPPSNTLGNAPRVCLNFPTGQ